MGIFDIMHDVDFCLLGGISQAAADAKSLDIWTNATFNLTTAWTTRTDNFLENQAEDADGIYGFNNLPNDPGKFLTWIQKYCTAAWLACPNPNDPLERVGWSSATIIDFENLIAKYYTKDEWGAILGSVQSFAGMVSAKNTQETSTGDTEGKNMQSQMQTDNSSMQPISDFGSTWSQLLSSLSNILSQIGPG